MGWDAGAEKVCNLATKLAEKLQSSGDSARSCRRQKRFERKKKKGKRMRRRPTNMTAIVHLNRNAFPTLWTQNLGADVTPGRYSIVAYRNDNSRNMRKCDVCLFVFDPHC